MLDLDTQLLRSLREGTLKLDCPNILVDGQHNGKPVTFRGHGCIEQSPEEGFKVTFSITGPPPDAFGNDGWAGGAPGTLLSSGGTLKLVATDLRGRKWLAEKILLTELVAHKYGDGYGAIALCYELHSDRTAPSSPTPGFDLELFIRGSIELPRIPSSRTKSFQACGLDFELFNHDGWFRVRAKSSGAAPPHLRSRVWEALLFTVATLEAWSVAAFVDGQKSQLSIRSPRRSCFGLEGRPPFAYRFSPPIVDVSVDVWQFFRPYLGYTLRENEKPFHPLSSQVLAVSRSAGASVEAQTLTLVVAVEAILKGFYSNVAAPSPAYVNSVKDIAEHIESWCGDDKIKKRAIGAVRGFSNARAADRLLSLIQQGVVSERGFEAWKKLRNQAAHGDWSTLSGNLQRHLDQLGAVRTLFYQLILHLIGYTGPQTDYGSRGHPRVPFPPEPAAADNSGPKKDPWHWQVIGEADHLAPPTDHRPSIVYNAPMVRDRIEVTAIVMSGNATGARSTPYKGQQHGQSHCKSESAAMGSGSVRRFYGTSAKVPKARGLAGGKGFAIAETD